MKKVFVILAVVFCIAFAGLSFAFGPRGGGGGCGMDGTCLMGPMMYKNLNLTREQAEKMWQLNDRFYNDTKGIRYQLFQKRFEMKELGADPKVQDAAILAKQKEINALKAQLQDKKAEFRLAQRKILTPEQIKKLDEHRRDGRFGHGPGAGGPGSGHGPHGGFGPAR